MSTLFGILKKLDDDLQKEALLFCNLFNLRSKEELEKFSKEELIKDEMSSELVEAFAKELNFRQNEMPEETKSIEESEKYIFEEKAGGLYVNGIQVLNFGKNSLSKETVKQMFVLESEGKSNQEIAKELGCSIGSVYMYLRKVSERFTSLSQTGKPKRKYNVSGAPPVNMVDKCRKALKRL